MIHFPAERATRFGGYPDETMRQTERSFFNTAVTAVNDCLAGGGDLGARMRALDWSKTPLGPLANWPASLRTSVSIVLSSRFPLLVWWGPDLVLLYNDAYAPILGKRHPNALGKKGKDVWPEIWHIVGPTLARVMQHGEASWSEDQMLPLERDGFAEECYFTFSYSPIRDEDGVAGVFTAVTETTPRVLFERRMRTLRALTERAAESKTAEQACSVAARVLAENPADVPFSVIYLIAEDGLRAHLVAAAGINASVGGPTIVELSEGATDPWGIRDALASVRVIADVERRVGSLPSGPWPDPVKRALVLPLGRSAGRLPQGVLIAAASPRLALDDAYRSFFQLAAEHVAAAVANARAFETERKRVEALAELDRAKSAFFSNVTHEFRTPLTLVLGPLQDLLAEAFGSLTEAQREQAQLAYRNALRSLKLVDTLLDLARIEGGRVSAIYEPVDLAQITSELASAFRSATERAGLELEVKCAPLPAPVYVDRDFWEKIVLNLLSNAFKFTFEGRIVVTLVSLGNFVELAVADTGTGIAESDLPNIFARFYRLKNVRSRTKDGTGIGLALVQELVRLHGGELFVDSELGKGSTFRVRIPTGSEHLPKDRIGASRALASTAVGSAAFVEEALRWLPDPASTSSPERISGEQEVFVGNTGRVLVADDNADMRDYLRRLLGQRWNVDAVADGQQALDLVERNLPDLVLTDVMLPKGGGFELLRALKSDPRTSSIPVVMLSARAGEEARVEGLGAGADDYLVKPFSARELIARVSSQLAIAKARQTLERQRAEFYELFMQAPAPICVLRGPTLTFEMANPSYLKLCGHSNVVGSPFLEIMPDLGVQGIDAVLRRVIETARPSIQSEVVIRHGHGERRDTYWTFVCAPLRDSEGNVDHVMVFANEITDQVQARNELELARQQAEAANRAKDEFLAMLGHELRNPLAPITTALELMKVRAGDHVLNERTVIERQVQHLVRLVDDLLDVSRIARGKIQLRRKRVDLAEIVSKAIEMASPLFEERNHRLAMHVPHGIIVYADEVRLAQVIANLLTNAAKYTDPGGNIVVRVSREKAEAVLSVRDSGIGITPELLPRIFDLFVQGKRADFGQSGLGLGLTLVRSLVTLHGGTVSAYSEGPRRGSEFIVRIPLSGSTDSMQRVELRSDRAAAPPKVRRRVLVVDDNRDAAEVLAETLRVYGHEARLAFDGPGALDVAASFHPEVALLDIGLPVMDGYELARRLRELPEGRSMRLIAVTGYGQESDRRRSREAGFDRHLVKPIDVTTLDSLIEQLFRGSDMPPPSSIG